MKGESLFFSHLFAPEKDPVVESTKQSSEAKTLDCQPNSYNTWECGENHREGEAQERDYIKLYEFLSLSLCSYIKTAWNGTLKALRSELLCGPVPRSPDGFRGVDLNSTEKALKIKLTLESEATESGSGLIAWNYNNCLLKQNNDQYSPEVFKRTQSLIIFRCSEYNPK